MIWNSLLWLGHYVFGWVSVVAFFTFVGARNRKPARILSDGRVEFAPNRLIFVAWGVVVIFLGLQAIELFGHSQGKPLKLAIAACPVLLAALLFFGFPGTIVIGSEGLQEVRWFWRDIRIRWEDIVEINTGKKSRAVMITDSDGTKITHSRQLPDRPRFLLELKQYCGADLPLDFPREPVSSQRTDISI